MFEFLPHRLFTNHVGKSNSGPSGRIWSQVTGSMMAADGDKRLFLVADDFGSVDNSSTYTEISSEQNYVGYIDDGGTILGMADEKGGALALATDGTDEDEIWISSGDGTQQMGQISDTAADAHLTAFECRYKVSSIVNSAQSHYIGMASPGLAAADTAVDATGAFIATKAFLGFRTLLDGDAIDCFYQAASQTGQVSITGAHVTVADTYVKLGWLYDPNKPTAERITWYVNNVAQATFVTGTNIAAATFPDAEALTFLAGFKNTTAVATEMAIDWWAFAQVIT